MGVDHDVASEKEDKHDHKKDVNLSSKPSVKPPSPRKRTDVCLSSTSLREKDNHDSYSKRKSMRQRKPTFKLKENESKLQTSVRNQNQKTTTTIDQIVKNTTSLPEAADTKETKSGDTLNKNGPIKEEITMDGSEDVENFESHVPESLECHIKSERPCADNTSNNKVNTLDKKTSHERVSSKLYTRKRPTKVMFNSSSSLF